MTGWEQTRGQWCRTTQQDAAIASPGSFRHPRAASPCVSSDRERHSAAPPPPSASVTPASVRAMLAAKADPDRTRSVSAGGGNPARDSASAAAAASDNAWYPGRPPQALSLP